MVMAISCGLKAGGSVAFAEAPAPGTGRLQAESTTPRMKMNDTIFEFDLTGSSPYFPHVALYGFCIFIKSHDGVIKTKKSNPLVGLLFERFQRRVIYFLQDQADRESEAGFPPASFRRPANIHGSRSSEACRRILLL
jgi:hypothetical protein